jgi:hypothetical protein
MHVVERWMKVGGGRLRVTIIQTSAQLPPLASETEHSTSPLSPPAFKTKKKKNEIRPK